MMNGEIVLSVLFFFAHPPQKKIRMGYPVSVCESCVCGYLFYDEIQRRMIDGGNGT